MNEPSGEGKSSEPLPEGTEGIRLSLESLGSAGDFGALAHYADPAYYTHCYRSRKHDVEYYAQLARGVVGPVLEFGCGNGRVTLAIAGAGASIHGVDLSRPMLNDLEQRLKKTPEHIRARVRLQQGDM